MGRLIDASVLLDKHAEQCGEKSCDTCRFIGKEKCASYMAITETPTAYSVEEVVKELEEAAYDSMHLDMSRPMTETWQIIDLDKAIEIVKEEGGIE